MQWYFWLWFAVAAALAAHDGIALLQNVWRSTRSTSAFDAVPACAAYFVLWTISAVAALAAGGAL